MSLTPGISDLVGRGEAPQISNNFPGDAAAAAGPGAILWELVI